jgi:hypothetical protein
MLAGSSEQALNNNARAPKEKSFLKFIGVFVVFWRPQTSFIAQKFGSLDYFGCKGTTIIPCTREKVVKEPRLTIFYLIFYGSIEKEKYRKISSPQKNTN